MSRHGTPDPPELMTIGVLARRGRMSVAAIRRFEALGLIYSAGRSPANYRLFDETALWCIEVIRALRSLGLTLREITQLAAVYLEKPSEVPGPALAALLDRAEVRIADRLGELEAIRGRIAAFRSVHAAALAGTAGSELLGDPRRTQATATVDGQ